MLLFQCHVLLTMHDTQHHISFAKNIRDIQVTWVGASVDDAVHIKIQMIKFGQECRIGYNLINLRVTFTDPSVELEKKWKMAIDK